MFELAWPWMLATLPIPWLVHRYSRSNFSPTRGALRVPDLDDFRALPSTTGRSPMRVQSWWLPFASWCLLVFAASNPQWLGEPVGVPSNGRDLMLAIDLSESMEVEDFVLNGRTVDRLVATKAVASDFIRRRVGDRIGLLLFGEQAYLHVPLTFDRVTVAQLLDETVIGLAGRSTAIGDALGLAVKRLREQNVDRKIVILMTDGANTSGQVEPLRAAKLAAAAGLRVYTIGIGADEMLVRQIFGTIRVNPSTDLDEDTMKEIAKATGGRYFRARDVSELEAIYAELDKLEPTERGQQHFRPERALFHWPLAIALLGAGCVGWRHTRGAT
ncbi:MAG: VWA domain-containing protein [Gammaproteobacteria bacterium]|nr:VWA domain-containing protein [Gammaproteobacteria bacterium]